MILQWLINQLTWKQIRRLTDSELLVIEHLIPANDSRSAQLRRQATDAPCVQRELTTAASYKATIPYGLDSSNLIDLEEDITSPEVLVLLTRPRHRVSFRLNLCRGGFLYSLEGRNLDGNKWQKSWELDRNVLAECQPVNNWLPPQMSAAERTAIIKKLECWLGLLPGTFLKYDADSLRVYEPCTDAQIRVLEAAEQLTLPDEYKAFLNITNGISFHKGRPFDIYGIDGLRAHELDSRQQNPTSVWLVTDLFEQGAAFVEAGSEKVRVQIDHGDGVADLGAIKEYIVEAAKLLDGDEVG